LRPGDEGHTYEGLTAIKEWKAETKKKFNHTIAQLELSHRDGMTVLAVVSASARPGDAKPTGRFGALRSHDAVAATGP
jgi:hypothetical protein